MADKIHPSSKQFTGNPNPNFPASKPRPVYRPQAFSNRNRNRNRNRRSCCCRFCLWITVVLFLLILIAAAAGGVLYVLYRPHRPSFAVTSLQVVQFNLTSSNQLNTKFNFTVTARNPNKKITFGFDSVSVAIDSNGVDVGDGSLPAFVMPKKNVTRLRTVVAANGRSVEDSSGLKSDLKSKKSVPVVIRLDTKVKVKVGSLKTKKVPIRVVCKGVRVMPLVGKAVTITSDGDVKCEVDVRIKIWKWTI